MGCQMSGLKLSQTMFQPFSQTFELLKVLGLATLDIWYKFCETFFFINFYNNGVVRMWKPPIKTL